MFWVFNMFLWYFIVFLSTILKTGALSQMLPFPPSKPIPNLLNHLSNSLLKPLRQIPLTFFEYWLSRKCDHLICTPGDEPFQYRNSYDSYWIPLMLEFSFGKFVIDETKKNLSTTDTAHMTQDTPASLSSLKRKLTKD